MKFKNKKTGEIKEWNCIEINSSLVSAQNRKRLYWSNIKGIKQPEDRGILLKDIIECGDVDRDKSLYVTTRVAGATLKEPKVICRVPEANKKGYIEDKEGECADLTFPNSKTRRGRAMKIKSNCLTASGHKMSKLTKYGWRKLTPTECERLQTVPDNYTLVPLGNRMMSKSQRYKMLGNGWTVDVISHIFNNIK